MLHCDRLDDDPKILPCSDSDMERRQFRCRALFDRCFPKEGANHP